MSEYEDGYPEDAEDEAAPDPATVAFLDQQEAQFAEDRERFKEIYGFDHDCHCSEDYTDGKLAEVTQCFLTLTSQALHRSAEVTYENRVLSGLVEELLKVNKDLMDLLVKNGLSAELEKYVTETYELDEAQMDEIQMAFDIEETETQDAGEDTDTELPEGIDPGDDES